MKPDKLAAGGVLGLGFWLGLEGEVTSGAWWSLMLESKMLPRLEVIWQQ